MAGTARWGRLSGSLALLLVLTLTPAAAPAAPDEAAPSLIDQSPAAFAERTAGRGATSDATSFRSLVELFVLAVTCAVGVAFYSTVAGARRRRRSGPRPRRRKRSFFEAS